MTIPRPAGGCAGSRGTIAGLGFLAILGTFPTAAAREPDLRVAKTATGDVVVSILPSGPGDPLAWNLYRGELADVASWLQRGDPDGRCEVPGADRAVVLAGETVFPGNYYYLLTAVDALGGETGLGTQSDAVARVNTFPCPAPCGSEVVPTATISGTEGLAIAPDGTVYYSQSGAVGRRLAGGAAENRWVLLVGATTVWGMALRDDGMLFVGSPSAGGNVYRIDTTQVSPTAQVLYPAAGSANGVTVGPDAAVYYSDFNGDRVYRVDDAGVRTQVTAAVIDQANGLLFDDDGKLLVLAYGAGQVWRLTLDASMVETSRVLAGTFAGSRLDGIAKDVTGRYYLTDNSAGRLLRVDSAFANTEVLLTGTPAAANIAWGKGPLGCMDVYVASSGALGLFTSDATGRP